MALLLLVWIGVLVALRAQQQQSLLGDLNGLGRMLVLVLIAILILGRWGHSKQQRKQSGTSNMSWCV